MTTMGHGNQLQSDFDDGNDNNGVILWWRCWWHDETLKPQFEGGGSFGGRSFSFLDGVDVIIGSAEVVGT